jgi:large subunit ribosomal protein L44e
MKLPKQSKAFCPSCKKHTECKITQSKQRTFGTAKPQGFGNRRQEVYKAKVGNKGRYSRKPVKQRKMFNKKTSKKVDLRYECSVCKKQHMQGGAWRAKRVEFA